MIRGMREMSTNCLKTLECGVIWYVTRCLQREHKMCRVMSRVFRLSRKVIWTIFHGESSQEFHLFVSPHLQGIMGLQLVPLVWGCAWQLKLHTSQCSWSLKPSPDSLQWNQWHTGRWNTFPGMHACIHATLHVVNWTRENTAGNLTSSFCFVECNIQYKL